MSHARFKFSDTVLEKCKALKALGREVTVINILIFYILNYFQINSEP